MQHGGFSSFGFNSGYGGGTDVGWQKGRGHGRERGTGMHQGGRGGGRSMGGDNVHRSSKEPVGAMANDVQTSEGQAPQMAKPNPEVAQDGKADAAILQIQNVSRSVGEKRKEPQDHIMTYVVDESGGPEGSKAKDKEKEKWCFMCRTSGHTSAVCTTELFCVICENDEHIATTYPLKKKQRPVAHVVGYAVDDLGFYHIPHTPFTSMKKESNVALIWVEEGPLPGEALRDHLKSLIPGKFEWNVQYHA
jgi:hypothetical protein